MNANYTVKKSFDLSGDDITNSLSGLKYCVIAKNQYSALIGKVKARITLLIHSCTSAFFMVWNTQKRCIRDVDVIIKAIDDFVSIIKNDTSHKHKLVNRTRKINNEYGIRFYYYNLTYKVAHFHFTKRKRVFENVAGSNEKTLLALHSDSVYAFPLETGPGGLKQCVTEAGLSGLCVRLLNLREALNDFKVSVKQAG